MDNNAPMPWWRTLYDEYLAAVLLENTDSDEGHQTLDFLSRYAGLTAGQRVLDQCCGTGRLTELLALDHQVVGVDLIPEYVEIAAKKTQDLASPPSLYCEDAMNFCLSEPADLVINWWTSFGYCAEDAENQKMLLQAYNSLRPGGYFALDFMNVPGIYRHFETDVMRKTSFRGEELILLRHSEIDFARDVLKKDWLYLLASGEKVEHKSEVKLYSPATLVTMLSDVGFQNIRIFGDLDGRELSLDSRRCIVVGQRR